MGVVYQAENTLLKRDVAVKILPERLAGDGSALRRFLQEARAVAKLEHPNVVGIYDVDCVGGTYFLAMQLVRGTSAWEFIQNRGPFNWPEATRIAADACRALAAAHAAGLVHRDVKPSNIMRGRDGAVKLADFGLAVTEEQARSGTAPDDGLVVGTPNFMSPEQAAGKPVDARSDLYSLGATYLTLLTGRPPSEGVRKALAALSAPKSAPATPVAPAAPTPAPGPRRSDTVILNTPVGDGSPARRGSATSGSSLNDALAARPPIPESCLEVVRRATAFRPENRFRDAAEMLAALEEVLDGSAARSADRSAEWRDFLTTLGHRPLSAASSSGTFASVKAAVVAGPGPAPVPSGATGRLPAVRAARLRNLRALAAGLASASVLSLAAAVPLFVGRPGPQGASPDAAATVTETRPGSPADEHPLGSPAAVAVPPTVATPTLPHPPSPTDAAPFPPAGRSIGLAADASAPGWSAGDKPDDASADWIIGGGSVEAKPSGGSASAPDRILRKTACLPTVRFDLEWTMDLAGAESAGIEFNLRGTGRCVLTLDRSGGGRIDAVRSRSEAGTGSGAAGGTEVLASFPAARGPGDKDADAAGKGRVIRLLADGKSVRVSVDGRTVAAVADAPAPDPADRRIVLFARGGPARFGGLSYRPVRTGAEPDASAAEALVRAGAAFRDPAAADLLAEAVRSAAAATAAIAATAPRPADVDADLLSAACETLAAAGPRCGDDALSALLSAASAEGLPAAVRRSAAESLARVAPAGGKPSAVWKTPTARRAAESVVGLAGHRDAVLRAAAAAALPAVAAYVGPGVVRPEDAVRRMAALLDDPSPSVRVAAYSAVAGAGRMRAEALIPGLRRGLDRPETLCPAAQALLAFPDRPDLAAEAVLASMAHEPATPAESELADRCRRMLRSPGRGLVEELEALADAGRFTPRAAVRLCAALYPPKPPDALRVSRPFPVPIEGEEADPVDAALLSSGRDPAQTAPHGEFRPAAADPRTRRIDLSGASERGAAGGSGGSGGRGGGRPRRPAAGQTVYLTASAEYDAAGLVDIAFEPPPGATRAILWVGGRRVADRMFAESPAHAARDLIRRPELEATVPVTAGRMTLAIRCDLGVRPDERGADGSEAVSAALTVSSRPAPERLRAPAVLTLFEDDARFAADLADGAGDVHLDSADAHSGAAALRVAPPRRMSARLPDWRMEIGEGAVGRYRFLRFAWKKIGGERAMIGLAADGRFGDPAGSSGAVGPVGPPGPSDSVACERRYFAGAAPPAGKGVRLGERAPSGWTEHTVDLLSDFGPFTLTGLRVSPTDGEALLLDRVFLARSREALARLPAPVPAPR
jgi:serine/threonine protein kinase